MPSFKIKALFFAAAVIAGLQAMPAARAASERNPCGQTQVIQELMTKFNATPAAKDRHLAMVEVVQMRTVAQAAGLLVCHGVVFDSEGAKTPMKITVSKSAAGQSSWSLRLDDPVHLTASTS